MIDWKALEAVTMTWNMWYTSFNTTAQLSGWHYNHKTFIDPSCILCVCLIYYNSDVHNELVPYEEVYKQEVVESTSSKSTLTHLELSWIIILWLSIYSGIWMTLTRVIMRTQCTILLMNMYIHVFWLGNTSLVVLCYAMNLFTSESSIINSFAFIWLQKEWNLF